MVKVQNSPNDHSELSPSLRQVILPTLHRGEAMGFLEVEQTERVSEANIRLFLDRLWESRVGRTHVSSIVNLLERMPTPSEETQDYAEQWLKAFEGVSTALRENPVPDREWQAALRVFDAEQLADLLRISPTSVQRYARGTRETPQEIASRLHWLAIVIGYLSGSYNDFGIRRWFERSRTALGGKSPKETLLSESSWQPEDDAAREIEKLAHASTGMVAT